MPDVARMYMDDQAEAKTPMVFVTRDGDLHATVVESGKYRHLLRVEGEPTEVEKLTLEYHRSEEHTSELQSQAYLVCRLLLEKKKIEKTEKISNLLKTIW